MLADLQRDARIFGASVGMAVRAQMQHRRAFLVGMAAQLLSAVTDLIAIMVLVHRFHVIDGWSLRELALLYGLVTTALSSALLLAAGIDGFDGLIRGGDFDAVRVRPCRSLVLVAGQRFETRRLGRVIQGVVVLLWALAELHQLHLGALALVLGALSGGTALFIGMLVIQATLCFWTIEGLEVCNVATYGGETLGSYPLSVFHRAVRIFLTGILPIAAISYGPALLLTHRATGGLGDVLLYCAPLSGVLFLVASLVVWQLGLRRYASTGS